jgi:hypothetical protein
MDWSGISSRQDSLASLHVYILTTIVTVFLTAMERGALHRQFYLSATKPIIGIGRASRTAEEPYQPKCDNVWIRSPILSRSHGLMMFGDEAHPLILMDRSSTHGTYVDSKRIRPEQEFALRSGQLVTFGSAVLHGDSKRALMLLNSTPI